MPKLKEEKEIIHEVEETEEEWDPFENDHSIYKGKARKSLVENDELSAEEDGFMRGYDDDDYDKEEEEISPEEEYQGKLER